tara:strand:+ start:204 stop:1313 length:1110 start_codon:yes stop_codon:yes gene_type:complete
MKRKLLPIVIALSALAVSASAAFYSVFGLSKLFAGASTQVIIMASSLEFAKLVVASLLYQYWDNINKILRIYLSISVVLLMIITSGGIYGYLSGAYQETAAASSYLDKQIAIIDQKRLRFEEQRNELRQLVVNWSEALTKPTTIQYVDKETGQLVTTTSSRQRRLLESQLSEAKINLNAVTDSISKLDIKILNKQIGNDVARELGPLKYLSNLLDIEMDKIINWFLLLIIFVFDPLAIAMVLAANFAFTQLKPKNSKEDYFEDRNKELERRVEGSLPDGAEWGVSYSVKDNNHFDLADIDELKHWTKVQRTSSMNITPQDETRMNIIGQNGNDGLHYTSSTAPTGSDMDIYNEKEKKRPKQNRGGGYWF